MSSGYWAGLRSNEKRLVVLIASVFFVVLNWLFVFPYFKEWGKVQDRMWEANRKLRTYKNEIAQTNVYLPAVIRMEGQGEAVPAEDQALHFLNIVNSQAGQSGVRFLSNSRINSTTNQFFVDLSQNISVQSQEQQLVDFLYNLGASNSLIRVRDLSLRPDPARQQLVASVTLVASYQKKPAAKSSSAGASPRGSSGPGRSPAVTPVAARPGSPPPITKQ